MNKILRRTLSLILLPVLVSDPTFAALHGSARTIAGPCLATGNPRIMTQAISIPLRTSMLPRLRAMAFLPLLPRLLKDYLVKNFRPPFPSRWTPAWEGIPSISNHAASPAKRFLSWFADLNPGHQTPPSVGASEGTQSRHVYSPHGEALRFLSAWFAHEEQAEKAMQNADHRRILAADLDAHPSFAIPWNSENPRIKAYSLQIQDKPILLVLNLDDIGMGHSLLSQTTPRALDALVGPVSVGMAIRMWDWDDRHPALFNEREISDSGHQIEVSCAAAQALFVEVAAMEPNIADADLLRYRLTAPDDQHVLLTFQTRYPFVENVYLAHGGGDNGPQAANWGRVSPERKLTRIRDGLYALLIPPESIAADSAKRLYKFRLQLRGQKDAALFAWYPQSNDLGLRDNSKPFDRTIEARGQLAKIEDAYRKDEAASTALSAALQGHNPRFAPQNREIPLAQLPAAEAGDLFGPSYTSLLMEAIAILQPTLFDSIAHWNPARAEKIRAEHGTPSQTTLESLLLFSLRHILPVPEGADLAEGGYRGGVPSSLQRRRVSTADREILRIILDHSPSPYAVKMDSGDPRVDLYSVRLGSVARLVIIYRDEYGVMPSFARPEILIQGPETRKKTRGYVSGLDFEVDSKRPGLFSLWLDSSLGVEIVDLPSGHALSPENEYPEPSADRPGVGGQALLPDGEIARRAVARYIGDEDAAELAQDLGYRLANMAADRSGLDSALRTIVEFCRPFGTISSEQAHKNAGVAMTAFRLLAANFPASGQELLRWMEDFQGTAEADAVWSLVVHAFLTEAAGKDITRFLLSQSDPHLARVLEQMLAWETPAFQRRLKALGDSVQFVNDQTPRGFGTGRNPDPLVARLGEQPIVRHRVGIAGQPARSISVQPDRQSNIDVKGTGFGGAHFPIGFAAIFPEIHGTWIRFGFTQFRAFRELTSGLRLQEVSLAALGHPLAICTPYQIVRVDEIPHSGSLWDVKRYIHAYAQANDDPDSATVDILKQWMQHFFIDLPSGFAEWGLESTIDYFLNRTPLVQLRSKAPPTDLRAVRSQASALAEHDGMLAELFAAYGETYEKPILNPSQEAPAVGEYKVFAYKANADAASRIVRKAATQLGETAGVGAGIGADLKTPLGISNVVGFSWAKDFGGAIVPGRDQAEFDPQVAESGLKISAQNAEEGLKYLVNFLGNESMFSEAASVFRDTENQTYQRVQEKVINNPAQSILHPGYVAAFKKWRDGTGGPGSRTGGPSSLPGGLTPSHSPKRYLIGALEGRERIVGESGQFVDGLSTSMARAGKPVAVVMPHYAGMMADRRVKSVRDLRLKFDLHGRTGEIVLAVDEVEVEANLTYFLIRDPEGLFFREPYQDSDGLRGLIEAVLLSKAIAAIAEDGDLVHTHGWQTALVHEYIYEERYRFLHTSTVATAERSNEKGIFPGRLLVNPEDRDQTSIIARLDRDGLNKFSTYKGRQVVSTHPLLGLERSIVTENWGLEYQSTKNGKQIHPGQFALLKAVRTADRVGISWEDDGDGDFNAFLAGLGGFKRVHDLRWPATGRPDPQRPEGLAFYNDNLYQPAQDRMGRRDPFQRKGSDHSVRFTADAELVSFLQFPHQAFKVLYPGSSVFTTSTADEWLMVIGRAVGYVIAQSTMLEGTRVMSRDGEAMVESPFLVFVAGLVADGTPVAGMVRGHGKKGLLHQMKQLIYHLDLMKVDVKTVFVRSPDGELKSLPFQNLKWLAASLRTRISIVFGTPEKSSQVDVLGGPRQQVDVRFNMQTGNVEQTDPRPHTSQALPPIQIKSLAAAG